jgi:hypothetical protein
MMSRYEMVGRKRGEEIWGLGSWVENEAEIK